MAVMFFCLSQLLFGDGVVLYLVFILFLIGTPRLAFLLSFWDMQPEYTECRACLRLIGSQQHFTTWAMLTVYVFVCR